MTNDTYTSQTEGFHDYMFGKSYSDNPYIEECWEDAPLNIKAAWQWDCGWLEAKEMYPILEPLDE